MVDDGMVSGKTKEYGGEGANEKHIVRMSANSIHFLVYNEWHGGDDIRRAGWFCF